MTQSLKLIKIWSQEMQENENEKKERLRQCLAFLGNKKGVPQ